jgi:hypothetical protein
MKKFGIGIRLVNIPAVSTNAHNDSDLDVEHKPGEEMAQRSTKMIMTIAKSGRFGNNMFQYAAMYGLAAMKGHTPVLSESFVYLQKAFHLPVEFISPLTMAKRNFKYHVENWNSETSLNKTMLDIEHSNDTDIILQGYFQSYLYFENVKEMIRKQFEFKESVKADVQEFFRDNNLDDLSRNITTVGIHVLQ